MNSNKFNNVDAMHSRATHNEHALAQALRQKGLSEDGTAFVALASDPFSDSPLRVVGFPDQTSGKSVLLDIRQELVITRPSTVLAGNNWDCHVAAVPFIMHNPSFPVDGMHGVTYVNGDITAQAAASPSAAFAPQHSALVHVCSAAAGDGTYDNTSPTVEYSAIQTDELTNPMQRARLIAGGFEVFDTTADFSKQGSVTMYRVDGDLTKSTITDTVTAALDVALTGSLPPQTAAQAKEINGVTNESKDGALVVLCYDTSDHPAEFPARENLVTLGSTSSGYSARLSPYSSAQSAPTFVRELGFLQSGAYFNGLNSDSTLLLVTRHIIEVFPKPGSSDMARARLAPAADPAAIEVLSILQSQTRPGHPVDWNSFGKFTRFLKNVLNRSLPFAKVALGAMGPEGAAVAQAITGAEKVVQDVKRIRKQKHKF